VGGEVGHRLGAAAIAIERGHVGPRRVEHVVAVDVALRGHRQAVGAGGDDGAADQAIAGAEVGDGFGPAAVGIEHGGVAAVMVDAAAGGIGLRGDGQAVGAGGGDDAAEQRAVPAGIADGLGAAAVGVDRDDVGMGAVELAAAGGILLNR